MNISRHWISSYFLKGGAFSDILPDLGGFRLCQSSLALPSSGAPWLGKEEDHVEKVCFWPLCPPSPCSSPQALQANVTWPWCRKASPLMANTHYSAKPQLQTQWPVTQSFLVGLAGFQVWMEAWPQGIFESTVIVQAIQNPWEICEPIPD